MIPAPPGLSARYKHEGKRLSWSHRRIVAFDDDSQPLVVDDHGFILPANTYAHFDGIVDHVDADSCGFSAIMPAGGWRYELTAPDGSRWDSPLAGWALKDDGSVVPLAVDGDGLVDELDADLPRPLGRGSYRVYHPDVITTEALTGPADDQRARRQALPSSASPDSP